MKRNNFLILLIFLICGCQSTKEELSDYYENGEYLKITNYISDNMYTFYADSNSNELMRYALNLITDAKFNIHRGQTGFEFLEILFSENNRNAGNIRLSILRIFRNKNRLFKDHNVLCKVYSSTYGEENTELNLEMEKMILAYRSSIVFDACFLLLQEDYQRPNSGEKVLVKINSLFESVVQFLGDKNNVPLNNDLKSNVDNPIITVLIDMHSLDYIDISFWFEVARLELDMDILKKEISKVEKGKEKDIGKKSKLAKLKNELLIVQNKYTYLRDIDNNIYRTHKIGNQVWMAENLRVIHYSNGDQIPYERYDNLWKELTKDACCLNTNGQLIYNWYAVKDSRGLAPEGWHIPSDEEWKELEMYLGMSRLEADKQGWRGKLEGEKLKHENYRNLYNKKIGKGVINSSGFSAVPNPIRTIAYRLWVNDFFWAWSSTEKDKIYNAWSRRITPQDSKVDRNLANKKFGLSVRCIKDL